MLGLMIVLIVGGLAVLIAASWYTGRKPYDNPSKPQKTMLYSHDSRDIADEVYFPAYRDSSMVFPRSKREKRMKSETYEQRNKD